LLMAALQNSFYTGRGWHVHGSIRANSSKSKSRCGKGQVFPSVRGHHFSGAQCGTGALAPPNCRKTAKLDILQQRAGTPVLHSGVPAVGRASRRAAFRDLTDSAAQQERLSRNTDFQRRSCGPKKPRALALGKAINQTPSAESA
jgi:hypothetical protein